MIGALIGFIIVGLIAGWLAGRIMRGAGFGFWGNLGVGVVGALIGGFVFRLLGLPPSYFVGQIIAATVGAIILLWVINVARR